MAGQEVERGLKGGSAKTLLDLIRKLMGELHPERRLTHLSLDSSLAYDIGLDSLAMMELLSRTEATFGIHIQEVDFIVADTPAELLQMVHRAAPDTRQATSQAGSALPERVTIALPESAHTLCSMLDWHARMTPDRTHIILYGKDGEPEIITYAQLATGARHLAASLQAKGTKPGQSVALMLPTGRDYLFSFFAILYAGAIPVPIYPPVRLSQIEDHLLRHTAILSNAQAVMLITLPKAKPLAALLRLQVNTLRRVTTVEELAAIQPPPFRRVAQKGDDIAFLQYTSGSTGSPKGVMLSHVNLLTNIRAMGRRITVGTGDLFVSWLPLYHDMGLIGAWLGSLYHAIPLVLMSPLSFLARPERWLWAIHDHKGTISAAPNFAYELSISKIDDKALAGLDLSSWRLAFNGAESVSAKTLRRFFERFAPYGLSAKALAPVYGLAECSVGLALPPHPREPLIDRIRREALSRKGQAIPTDIGDPSAQEVVACGQPLDGHEIRIVDREGKELPDRREGLLQFRGPSATCGYMNNPEQTRALITDGWLNSGDLAYRADGDIYLTSRSKDLVIRGGHNIYPYELEQAVGELPGIRKGCVAVFGSADTQSGTERIIVLAETKESGPERRAELEQRIHKLATGILAMPPDRVVLCRPHTLLKTSSGKLRRAATCAQFERGLPQPAPRSARMQMIRLTITSVVRLLRGHINRLPSTLYAVYAWGLFYLLAIPGWPLTMLLPGIGARWRLIRGLSNLFCTLAGIRLTVTGLEHFKRGASYILVANHASYIDGIALTAALPFRLCFIAKGEFQSRWIPRLFLQRIGCEFVQRQDKQAGVEDTRRLTARAAKGQSVLFFPEGTFQPAPGLLPFCMGAFITAAHANRPVLPITLNGSRKILRSGSWFPRHGALAVIVGKPIEPKSRDWQGAIALRNRAREVILGNSIE